MKKYVCIACKNNFSENSMFTINQNIGVVHCNKCQSSFLSFPENPDTGLEEGKFDEYWDEVNQKIYSSDGVVRELTEKYKKYFSKVKGREPRNNLLDVGSGFGISVNSARKLGFEAEGIEPSKSAVEFSSKKFGIKVTQGLLENDTFKSLFGVVSSWDVIEHVLDPEEFVKNCNRHLEMGGWIILETPDEGAFIRKLVITLAKISKGILDYRSKMYYKEHRFYFSRDGIRMLLERNGFKNVRFFKEGSMIEKEILKNKLYSHASGLRLFMIRTVFTIIKHVPAASNKMIIIAEKDHEG